MCVSTCQVEFVLRELSFFILLPRVDLSEFILKELPAFNYYPAEV